MLKVITDILKNNSHTSFTSLRESLCVWLLVLPFAVHAQSIKIGGNVYGGGNQGNVRGSTKVTVRAGDIGAVDEGAERPLADPKGKVFGGARMANVGGSTFVHIDGENATGYILVNQVFGGNDMAGQVGTAQDVGETMPSELTAVKRVDADETDEKKNDVDDTFNSYVRISTKATNEHYTAAEIAAAVSDPEDPAYGKSTSDVKPAADAKKVYIGQLFAGSNGDYDYEQSAVVDGMVTHYIYNSSDKERTTPLAQMTTAEGEAGFHFPELDKTYLEVVGGSIVYAYGGGNKATVKEQNIIHIDNPSAVVNHIWTDSSGNEVAEGTEGATDLLTTERFKEMGINTTFSKPSSGAYQVGRFFGGNNKAEMAIRPTWNLLAGKVRNLYSGGNQGAMTCPEGMLLEIKDYSSLIVDNLFGGCRMADVKPTVDGGYVACANLPGYYFPNGLAARVLVRGGHVNNVYGGNDVTGDVYGGNAIGIYTTVYGDVYGGGNGNYPYTDIESMKDDDSYGDFCYEVPSGMTSAEALNAFRPHAEQVSIRLKGTSAMAPTKIHGSLFVGGNCASISSKIKNPLVELKMGSYVIADKVFLGNNGEGMIDSEYLAKYAEGDFSTLSLKDASVFSKYMDGVAMTMMPNIKFDATANGDPDDYEPYTSYVGSFYCGGNVGSMAIPGKQTFTISQGLNIFEKFVGGCNNADVAEGKYNAAYSGGLLGATDERGATSDQFYTDTGLENGNVKDRLEINLDNLTIVPLRWNNKVTKDYPIWNTQKWNDEEGDFEEVSNSSVDDDTRLLGGNVYGGCYESGHVNGNVVININEDLIKKDWVFEGAGIYGRAPSGVSLEDQRDDLMAVAMTVFGAGFGKDTEIWGSTTVNHNRGYAFQIFGGGEEGVVGKKVNVSDEHGNITQEYHFDERYSSTVNLSSGSPVYSDEGTAENLAETEYIYGGGNEGNVCGNTYVHLGNGRVYDAFGGASNADILGGAIVNVGHNGGFPWVIDNIYGGNDFGGTIKGGVDHSAATTRTTFDAELLTSSTYVNYIQGHVDSIFGGNYGSYNYTSRIFSDYTDAEGIPLEGFSFPHLDNNSFVHFQPADNSNNHVSYIFGGSQGYPGNATINNVMQQESYVLVDDTETKDANRFASMDIYGGGAFAGVGTLSILGVGRTAVDLYAGSFHNIYGGSNREGLIGYTRVNVPAESTARVNAIFGGGQGYSSAEIAGHSELAMRYCDHYVTCIDYKGANAIVNDAIYGGNENSRVACDTYINIEAPVNQSSGYQATVYGAGYGAETVSGRTNVFMNSGSSAYKVFGGGRDGNAFNFQSLSRWLASLYGEDAVTKVPQYRSLLENFGTYLADTPITLPANTGTYANSSGVYNGTHTNDILTNSDFHQTNVHIMDGGYVGGYAYGGGYGENAVVGGTTYIELKGGTVNRDIYGGGEGGPVYDEFGLKTFTATTNVYVEGGMVRNVYGGGYQGHVGKHEGALSASYTSDIPGEAHVTIGKVGTNTFKGGAPAVMRNVYGGGEGGSVYGSSNVTINNGYIGYRYKNTGSKYEYVEELDDQQPNAIEMAGNVFGGGYVINSYVDSTTINMYGGTVRGSLYGGGEVGPVGRGSMKDDGGLVNGNAHIYRAGTTNVNMYSGHVLRNVFGGGRGKDSWGGDGTMYMDQDQVAALDMKSKGYVFGQTRVSIHGGEIGSEEGMAYGYGNVFGGCDEGTVYSAFVDTDGTTKVGNKSGNRYDGDKEGYYYNSSDQLTEDCKVVVEPYAQTTGAVTLDKAYASGAYVPISVLNTLGNRNSDTRWQYLDPSGVIIHNAVFAGGNIAEGSSSLYANATTVYGNATASIHDVYNRDLITIGTGHTGGLYGDGNLTFVDGYRELNITNYGTDYYHIAPSLTYEQYLVLPTREQAYYELKYKCIRECTDIEGTTYKVDAELPQDEILALFSGIESGGTGTVGVIVDGKPSSSYWEEKGVVSVYAGRIMNTIQRADFCGVFGSRMVMKGAPDRVPEEADYTNYTINRVREVSLNEKASTAGDTGDNATHGNYFGIYSIVNYLGALTSDVKFSDVRKTNSSDASVAADGTTTYYDWKSANIGNKKRNNGTCHNHLALASGVYLELTTEKSTGNTLDTKDWGPITGIIELDLINVQTGIGGGFVYAKNVHGEPTGPNGSINTLTALNSGAATKGQYTYTDHVTSEGTQKEWETSGNFIHSSQTIIDDCYNISSRYKGSNAMPAHYWYIAGSIYVYDQYISAYTGSPNAFSETVEIPITINAAANGTMTLMDVQPNRYAYYSSANTELVGDQKLVIGEVTYQRNTPISYWDWNKLPAAERALFVSDTYVNTQAYKTSAESEEIIAANSDVRLSLPTGNLYSVAEGKMVPASDIFHSSNNMSHDTGYLLTYNTTNPGIWNKWYTPVSGSAKNQTGGDGYQDGPTYHPTTSGLYGQQEYDVNAIIPKKTFDDYAAINTAYIPNYGLTESSEGYNPDKKQATFVPAYIVTSEYTSASQHYYPGAPVSADITGYTSPAYVCTSTIQLSPTEYIYVNDLMTEAQKNQYKADYSSLAAEIEDLVKPAYICTEAGLYGGSYYDTDKNYRALEAYSAMSPTDRSNFKFKYDALDLLIDPTYGGVQGQKYQYDSEDATLDGAQANAAGYSLTQHIDYSATYNGATDVTPHNGITLTNGVEYTREQYESLPNEQRHYAPISVRASSTETTVYVIKESFMHGETPYAVGTTISSETYSSLTDTEKSSYITTLYFPSSGSDQTYYYCRESYKVGENGEGVDVTKVNGTGESSYTTGGTVPVGFVIDASNYTSLKNYQKNFIIHGVSPMETSTLYVARDADINDLSTEKIITVVYRYDYEESDVEGLHITPVSERHVVNIHITFKSGVPTVDNINPPTIVLPGTGITMRIPSITPGAYEITGGGWELFDTETNAESHINGKPYTPSVDPLYWYQDGFYLAYYAKTYLGKAYSNYVPVSVANYHDLKRVMDATTHHYYIDNPNVKRYPKIYINDYSDTGENGLDLLKNLYDLSVLSGSPAEGTPLYGHALLDSHVRAGENLEFFLRTDISVPSGSPAWTPIAPVGGATCFEGVLHGDGHTISGLDNSLFGRLCGSVYNLGVTGSFNTGGIADTGDGYVESCWVKTTATTPLETETQPYAVFGDPTASTGYQVVNSYFCDSNSDLYNTTTADGITTSGSAHGLATAMPARAFYNGELAYDLNNFYLYKRYSDNTALDGFPVEYKYWKPGEAEPQTGHYADNAALCSSGYNNIKYVENRFADGDFRYADGTIPETEDERCFIDAEVNSHYYPIWPDDYIFFGQKLTYGWAIQAHQDVPTAVARSGGRLSTVDDANRVYRAPAYYRSKAMGVAYFNPDAYLAYKSADGTQTVSEKPMTAIDFAGHNDLGWQLPSASAGSAARTPGSVSAGSAAGTPGSVSAGLPAGTPGSVSGGLPAGGALFYPPLLDDDGLTGIVNQDETQNLLVYAPAEGDTHDVLADYFVEPVYAEGEYRTVAVNGQTVKGHLVTKSGSDFLAQTDHILVDKQDFNCPVSYTFATGKRMWHQRHPDRYFTPAKGWDAISLPFTAELVTTQTKGEITHFYSGSASIDGATKTGHEYWLREYKGKKEEDGDRFTAAFNYPDAGTEDKTVENTFLWDYYYSFSDRHDKNADSYQTYYASARDYAGYPLLAQATPYIIGFPGSDYNEFDLSGEWTAPNTASPAPALVSRQVITFASKPAVTIGVSDTELAAQTLDGYAFTPTYMTQDVAGYILNADGNRFERTEGGTALPFRPYFTAASQPQSAPARRIASHITIDSSHQAIGYDDDEPEESRQGDGALHLTVNRRRIIVSSTLQQSATVSVVNTAGIVIDHFIIEPGETHETHINLSGIYLVNRKKIIVR